MRGKKQRSHKRGPGQNDGVCISQGGRFPRFSLEGHPPRRATKGAIGLTLCRVYRKKTCCDVVQTHAAVLFLQRLATSGEASKECLKKWEVLECSICDPQVGVTPGPPLLCPSFCESYFSACSGTLFSAEPLAQVLMPCGPRDILCARAREWAFNSSTFCELSGFAVLDSTESLFSLEEKACFDGKAESAEPFMGVVEANQKSLHGPQYYSAMNVLKNWTDNMNVAEQITWAIGGLVLTTGALHWSRRNLVKHEAAPVMLRDKQAVYKGSSTRSGTRKERRHSPKAL